MPSTPSSIQRSAAPAAPKGRMRDGFSPPQGRDGTSPSSTGPMAIPNCQQNESPARSDAQLLGNLQDNLRLTACCGSRIALPSNGCCFGLRCLVSCWCSSPREYVVLDASQHSAMMLNEMLLWDAIESV